jgi:hypothetical protein
MHHWRFLFWLGVGLLLGGCLFSMGARAQGGPLVIEICGHSTHSCAATCGSVSGPYFCPESSGSGGSPALGSPVGSVNVGTGGSAVTIPIDPATALPTPPGWTPAPPGSVNPGPPGTTSDRTYSVTGSGGGVGGPYSASTLAAAKAAMVATLPTSGFACDPGSSATYSFINETATSADLYANYAPAPPCAPGVISTISIAVACPDGYTDSSGVCTLTTPADVMKPSDGKCGVTRVGNTYTNDPKDPDCGASTGAAAEHGVTVSGGQLDATSGGSTIRSTIDGGGNTTIQKSTPTSTGTTITSTVVIRGSGGATPYTVAGTGVSTAPGTGTMAGTPTPSTGRDPCGLPGTPACKIDETGTPTAGSVTQAGTFGAGNTKLDDAAKSRTDAMTTYDPGKGAVAPSSGWFPSLGGSDSCTEPVTWTWMGLSMPLNVCAIYAPFKAVLAFALWLWLGVFAWLRVTRGAAAAVG